MINQCLICMKRWTKQLIITCWCSYWHHFFFYENKKKISLWNFLPLLLDAFWDLSSFNFFSREIISYGTRNCNSLWFFREAFFIQSDTKVAFTYCGYKKKKHINKTIFDSRSLTEEKSDYLMMNICLILLKNRNQFVAK